MRKYKKVIDTEVAYKYVVSPAVGCLRDAFTNKVCYKVHTETNLNLRQLLRIPISLYNKETLCLNIKSV